jgi:hypothetical protein
VYDDIDDNEGPASCMSHARTHARFDGVHSCNFDVSGDGLLLGGRRKSPQGWGSSSVGERGVSVVGGAVRHEAMHRLNGCPFSRPTRYMEPANRGTCWVRMIFYIYLRVSMYTSCSFYLYILIRRLSTYLY